MTIIQIHPYPLVVTTDGTCASKKKPPAFGAGGLLNYGE